MVHNPLLDYICFMGNDKMNMIKHIIRCIRAGFGPILDKEKSND